jgi:heme-degrading monooxygenase HmoA
MSLPGRNGNVRSSLPPESCVEREQPLEWNWNGKGEERTMGERSWASGHWRVKDGKTEEFIQQWDEWLTQSSAPVPGFHHAKLLRSLSHPNLFTSISEWDNAASRDAWKASPGFQEGFTASQALCDEFVGGDYDEVVVVSKPIRNPG